MLENAWYIYSKGSDALEYVVSIKQQETIVIM